jgi:hypothetical protein
LELAGELHAFLAHRTGAVDHEQQVELVAPDAAQAAVVSVAISISVSVAISVAISISIAVSVSVAISVAGIATVPNTGITVADVAAVLSLARLQVGAGVEHSEDD